MKPDSSIKQMLAAFSSPFFYPLPVLAEPTVDGGWVSLSRHALGLLGCEVQAAQDAAEMAQVVLHAEVMFDDFGHAGTSPRIANKSQRFGSPKHGCDDLLTLFVAELGGRRGMRPGRQSIIAPLARLPPPLSHRAFVAADDLGDLSVGKVMFFSELHRMTPTKF
jgi:hypothetical protein